MPKAPPEKEVQVELVKVADLNFDPRNPRFSRYFADADQPTDEVLERMIKAENVQELMGSIGEQGYFAGEPLLVGRDGEKLIVVEGNRRLAALKLLNKQLSPQGNLPSIDMLREEAKHLPTEVPCIIFSDRKRILRYLGYRHITGPKRWDSLSKARYLKQLKETFYAELPEDEQLRAIAKEIGSRKDYVAQILAGLAVFEHARANKFYNLQRVNEDDVDFGVLTTALSYSNISDFLGLKSRTDVQAEGLDSAAAHDLFSWMFAQDQQGDTILGESRNLRKLSAVVANGPARDMLKKEQNLALAYLHTEGPSAAFTKTLESALKKINEAYELIPSVDRFGAEHRTTVDRIEDRASDISLLINKALRKQRSEEAGDE